MAGDAPAGRGSPISPCRRPGSSRSGSRRRWPWRRCRCSPSPGPPRPRSAAGTGPRSRMSTTSRSPGSAPSTPIGAAEHVRVGQVDVAYVVGGVVVADLAVGPVAALHTELVSGPHHGGSGDVRVPPVVSGNVLVAHGLAVVDMKTTVGHDSSSSVRDLGSAIDVAPALPAGRGLPASGDRLPAATDVAGWSAATAPRTPPRRRSRARWRSRGVLPVARQQQRRGNHAGDPALDRRHPAVYVVRLSILRPSSRKNRNHRNAQ